MVIKRVSVMTSNNQAVKRMNEWTMMRKRTLMGSREITHPHPLDRTYLPPWLAGWLAGLAVDLEWVGWALGWH
jgi:hypothetical protein